MKRAILIATGTVGGLGAVLAITPPQLASSELALPSGNATGGNSAAQSAPTASTVSSKTSSSTKTSSVKASASSSSKSARSATKSTTSSATTTTSDNSTASSGTSAASTSPSPTPTKSVTKSTASGDFLGSAINVGYGIVQVKITVENGKITDAVAVQAPSGRNDRFTNYALPILKQQTLAAQSDAISGATGASYTSYGWYKSLQSALTKAGML